MLWNCPPQYRIRQIGNGSFLQQISDLYLITGEDNIKDKQLDEKENEGPIKSEQLDTETSGKPDSTTTPGTNDPAGDVRRSSGSGGKDGRKFREVN